jgi:hypothetical protein
MFKALDPGGPLSRFGRNLAIASVVMTFSLGLAEGLLYGAARIDEGTFTQMAMVRAWVTNFRYLFEQLIYVGALIFVGAKFIETRTILTVGFARLDADKMRLKGPDEDNVVWVGQRYGSKFEAEAMHAAMQNRMEESRKKG